jgi:hypothetical protein
MYQKADSEIATLGVGVFVGMVLLAIILAATKLSPNEMEKKAKSEAISHGAAHYVVDTNGVVSFEWNK